MHKKIIDYIDMYIDLDNFINILVSNNNSNIIETNNDQSAIMTT